MSVDQLALPWESFACINWPYDGAMCKVHGWPIYFDWANYTWRYDDDNSIHDISHPRRCRYCGLEFNIPTPPYGYGPPIDACLPVLPGVKSACCGHGDSNNAYALFSDGNRILGVEALKWMESHGKLA